MSMDSVIELGPKPSWTAWPLLKGKPPPRKPNSPTAW